MSLSRDELIEKIGGENQYNFLVTSFCENIQEDAGLKDIFMTFDLELLADRMTALLDIVLAQSSDSESLDESTRNKVVMNNYSLFEAGMNAKHFKKLQANFEAALQDAWVEEDLIEQCNRRFAKLQLVFEEEGAAMEQSVIAGRVVEVRMMVAKSA
mmetsp:Transcript_42993/g.104090  ORF Transcript_42993/g.104090 Transcript_42993/m.104090 type:complete len:156 (+) Transcript_42993:85-552(+)